MEIFEKDLQTMEYIKIYGANILAYLVANYAVLSPVEIIDVVLKICVAIPTIIYTCVKIVSIIKNEINKK